MNGTLGSTVAANWSRTGNNDIETPTTWSPFSGVLAVVDSAVILCNGFTMFLVLRYRYLKTPFNTYLMNLLLANMIHALLVNPFDLYTYVHSARWLFGATVCTAYTYFQCVVNSAMLHAHLLITANRLWAMTFPVSYRRYHNQKVAVCLSLFMWVYVHLLELPFVLTDRLYYPTPVRIGCFLNTQMQPQWAKANQFIAFNMPEVLILAAYPFICFKKIQRKRATKDRGANSVGPVITTYNTVGEPHRPAVTAVTASSRSFVILTLLTAGVLVFWTPMTVYYTILGFTRLDNEIYAETLVILFSLEAALDPIFFTLALNDVRTAAKRTIFCT